MKKISLLFFSFVCLSAYAQQWDWAKTTQGPGFEYGRSVSVDGGNNVYVTGEFYGTTMAFGQ